MLLTMAMWKFNYNHPVFMTFGQALKLGASVRKGEKSHLSLFFKPLEIDDKNSPAEDAKKTIPMARANRVFNVAQIDGLSDEFLNKFIKEIKLNDLSPIERAEAFIKNIPIDTKEEDRTPCYIPSRDIVCMPKIGQFKSSEQYYATFFHELTHATGHKSRLDRFKQDETSKDYAFEELVAEISSSFLLPSIGLRPIIDEEHAPYIAGYIKLLKDQPQAFAQACSQAEKATDWLNNYQLEHTQDDEEKAA